MSQTSQWPLPEQGVRFLTPAFMVNKLHLHPLTRDCYPTAMGFYPQAKGHHMRRQRHDDNLLMYCVDGKGSLDCDGNKQKIAAGDLILLPQGQSHHYRADSSQPWSLYWVHFQGVSSQIFLTHIDPHHSGNKVHVGLAPALATAFNNLLAVHRTGYNSAAFISAANLLRHLFTLFALENNRQQQDHHTALDMHAIQAYMRANIDQHIELESLAQIAHLSKYHFSNRYKALTGYSPIKHFLHMKVEYACQLLDSSSMSVKAIAAELGYADPLYFSRLFRQIMGLSPRAYRQSVRK